MASAFEVHTASEMVCLAPAGKLRLAQEASARKLATTEGSAFVGPIAVKSCQQKMDKFVRCCIRSRYSSRPLQEPPFRLK